jgi:hypothetical protein
MVGRDRRARRKKEFPDESADDDGRDSENTIGGAPGGRALPLISYLSFVSTEAKIAMQS